MSKFSIYKGDRGNLPVSNGYLTFKWNEHDCHVLFSVTKQGRAANSHFSSDKAGLRKLKQAVNEWCEFCFEVFDWCEMVAAVIERASVLRLAQNCGFQYVASFGKKQVCIRRR